VKGSDASSTAYPVEHTIAWHCIAVKCSAPHWKNVSVGAVPAERHLMERMRPQIELG
jgi:hypothetical protein